MTQQLVAEDAYIPSPCVRLCGLDPDTGLCRGCFRTLPEITGWQRFTNQEKTEVISTAESRRLAQTEN